MQLRLAALRPVDPCGEERRRKERRGSERRGEEKGGEERRGEEKWGGGEERE